MPLGSLSQADNNGFLYLSFSLGHSGELVNLIVSRPTRNVSLSKLEASERKSTIARSRVAITANIIALHGYSGPRRNLSI